MHSTSLFDLLTKLIICFIVYLCKRDIRPLNDNRAKTTIFNSMLQVLDLLSWRCLSTVTMAVQFKSILRVLLAVGVVTAVSLLYVSQFDKTDKPRQARLPSHVIKTVERHCLQFEYGGHMFNELGQTGEVHGNVTTCMIHSFSPYIEREAAKRFLDPARDNIYFANSPAITFHNDELVLVARIWLDRERYVCVENYY